MALLVLLLLPLLCFANNPDPARFRLWGPGLRSELHLPVRYFFIQAVDQTGLNITSELPTPPQVELRISSGGWLPIYSRIDYLGRGLYVFRWRMRRSMVDNDLSVSVSSGGQRVTDFVLKRPLFSDTCHCPEANFTAWTERLECPRTYAQIHKDFRLFPTINVERVMERFMKIFHPESVGACRYIIRDNQIFRKCFGKHVGFRVFIEAMLLSLTRKVRLPELDFVWNLGDWPLSRHTDAAIPILSWCGSQSTHDIVLPTYEMSESVLEMMGRQSIDVFSILTGSTQAWTDREKVAYFRGRDSSNERLDLVRLSLKKPNLVDARLTNMFFFNNDSTLGQQVPHVGFPDFFRYKYQVNMDGTVAPYRTPFLLAGGSVVLKQDSEYYEHFYSSLQPNVHFLTLKRDISDLEEKVVWLRENDDKARAMAEAARDFVFHHLSPVNIYCYYARVFELYSLRMTRKPEPESPGPGFERVTETEYVPEEKCSCHGKTRDEL